MDPREFLAVAISLHSSAMEAERRSAVSRAYYALYLTAQEFLEAEGLQFTHTAEDHQRVPRYLSYSGDSSVADVGDAIRDLLQERILADYRMGERKFNQRTCSLLVAKAEASLRVVDGVDRAGRRTLAATIKARLSLP